MPGRQIIGGEPYRYGFQGQEKDPETGKESFQLRLWDGRIGRWLTTDPYRQYHSPYVGMGNDPVNGIDPDGGYKTKWGQFLGWVGGGFKGSFTSSDNPGTPWHKYGINKSDENGLSFDFGLNNGGHQELMDYGYQNNETNYFNSGSGFMRDANKMDKYNNFKRFENWSNDINNKTSFGMIQVKKASQITYSLVDKVQIFGSGFALLNSSGKISHLNGEGIVRGGSEHIDNGLDGMLTVFPMPVRTGGINMGQFNKMFKKTFLTKTSSEIRGQIVKNYNRIDRFLTPKRLIKQIKSLIE